MYLDNRTKMYELTDVFIGKKKYISEKILGENAEEKMEFFLYFIRFLFEDLYGLSEEEAVLNKHILKEFYLAKKLKDKNLVYIEYTEGQYFLPLSGDKFLESIIRFAYNKDKDLFWRYLTLVNESRKYKYNDSIIINKAKDLIYFTEDKVPNLDNPSYLELKNELNCTF